MAQTEEVKLHFLDYWRVIRVRWVLILLAFLLVLVTAAVVTYFQPREYQSSVFIEVKSTAQNLRIFSNMGDPSLPIHDPQLAPTVFQIIQRTGILYPVIDDLKLQDKWTKGGTRPLASRLTKCCAASSMWRKSAIPTCCRSAFSMATPSWRRISPIRLSRFIRDKRVEEEKEIMNRAVETMNEEVAKSRRAT